MKSLFKIPLPYFAKNFFVMLAYVMVVPTIMFLSWHESWFIEKQGSFHFSNLYDIFVEGLPTLGIIILLASIYAFFEPSLDDSYDRISGSGGWPGGRDHQGKMGIGASFIWGHILGLIAFPFYKYYQGTNASYVLSLILFLLMLVIALSNKKQALSGSIFIAETMSLYFHTNTLIPIIMVVIIYTLATIAKKEELRDMIEENLDGRPEIR